MSEVDKNVPGVLLSFSQPEGQKQYVYAIEQGGARSYATESDGTRTSGVKDQTKNSLFHSFSIFEKTCCSRVA